MTSVTEVVDHALGVDSHRDTHTAAILEARAGSVTEELTVAASAHGYAELLARARSSAEGMRVWAIEGCGSYGAGLARFLTAAGEWVVEVERPARPRRQSPGKDDRIDAIRAGRETLGRPLEQLATPRQGETRDGLALLLMARRGAVDAASDAARQLHAAIVVAPDRLRARFQGLTTHQRVQTAARLRPDAYRDTPTATVAAALVSIARRHQTNTHEAQHLTHRITELVKQWRPDLLETNGVGPIVAATVLCAWSHPGRCRHEAAFASLAGTAPIPASSGRTTGRVRLNPGGDRTLNAAIHTIVLSRLRWDPETIAYRDRRRTEGKPDRETRRCLKRYITRQLFRQLNHPLDNP
jgi:transposase